MTGPQLNPGNRSVLQPTQLSGGTTVGLDVSRAPATLGGRSIQAATPQPQAPGAAAMPRVPVRLRDLKLSATAVTSQSEAARARADVIGKVINAIERTRGPDGKLSAPGLAMQGQLKAIRLSIDMLSEGPVVGDQLAGGIDVLRPYADWIQRGNEGLAQLQHGAVDEQQAQALELLRALSSDALANVQARMDYLGHGVIDSPMSAGKMYASKAQICKAAVAVLHKQMARSDLSDGARARLKATAGQLVARAADLSIAAVTHTGRTAHPRDVVGRKLLGGFLDTVLHLPTVLRQRLALKSHVDELLGNPGGTALETPEVDEQSIVEASLARTFKEAGLPPHDARHQMRREMNAQLNGQDWAPITNEIQLQVGKQTVFAYSEVTPAAAFIPEYCGHGFNAHSSAEGEHAVNLAQTRLADGQGRVLFSATRHAVVSAYEFVPKGVARMEDEELASHLQTLLPHACVLQTDGRMDIAATAARARASPSLVDAMRAQANKNRAEEIIKAMIVNDPGLLERGRLAWQHGGEGPSDPGRPHEVRIVELPTLDVLSLSLLTPDHVRSGVSSNERLMLADQRKAWEAMTGVQDLALTHPETGEHIRVRVNVNPMAMNYGVNQGALKGFGPISSKNNAISGWDDVKPGNDAVMQQLFGGALEPGAREGVFGRALAAKEKALMDRQEDLKLLAVELDPAHRSLDRDPVAAAAAQKHLESIQQLQREVTQARQLFDQILSIHHDGSYRSAGREPYKMPTRLAVLGDMLGVKVAFNCKSGKDRTGELDAEAKHLRLQMELTGQVPHHERQRAQAEIAQFHEVVTHSGNFEMQRLNTGYAGYKLKGVPELYEQFGAGGKKDPRTANFLGLSGYTTS